MAAGGEFLASRASGFEVHVIREALERLAEGLLDRPVVQAPQLAMGTPGDEHRGAEMADPVLVDVALGLVAGVEAHSWDTSVPS